MEDIIAPPPGEFFSESNDASVVILLSYGRPAESCGSYLHSWSVGALWVLCGWERTARGRIIGAVGNKTG